MEIKKFKDLELRFNELRNKADKGEIDSNTVNKELKKLMVMDDKGAYWIIGGNSGKWYRYDGKDWKEDNPFKSEKTPEIKETLEDTTKIIKDEATFQKTITKNSIEINDDTAQKSDDTKVFCKTCKTKINNFDEYCHLCGTNQNETHKLKKKNEPQNIIPELLVSSVNLISLIFFFGGIGIIIGVILGATIGIFKDIPIFIDLPQTMIDWRSNLSGGIVFAIIGGIAGFIVFSIKAIFIGSLYNMISYFFGGIRFRTKK